MFVVFMSSITQESVSFDVQNYVEYREELLQD